MLGIKGARLPTSPPSSFVIITFSTAWHQFLSYSLVKWVCQRGCGLKVNFKEKAGPSLHPKNPPKSFPKPRNSPSTAPEMLFPLLKMGNVLPWDRFYLIFPNLGLNTIFSTSLCLLFYSSGSFSLWNGICSWTLSFLVHSRKEASILRTTPEASAVLISSQSSWSQLPHDGLLGICLAISGAFCRLLAICTSSLDNVY